jgi:hypothetical protein
MSDGIPLPMYCIVGRRPVMAFETEDGGLDVQAFDWKPGEFERDIEYLSTILVGDADHVSEEEFNEHVEQLRRELGDRST